MNLAIHIVCLDDSSVYTTASLIHTLVGWLRLSWHIQPTSQWGGTAEGCITQNPSPPSESISSKTTSIENAPFRAHLLFSTLYCSVSKLVRPNLLWSLLGYRARNCDFRTLASLLWWHCVFSAKHLKGLLHRLSKFVITQLPAFEIKHSNEVRIVLVAPSRKGWS